MRTLAKQAIRILALLLLGGFLAATLVRVAPGFGVNEEDLDSRLSGASHAALHARAAEKESLARFYFDYWSRLLRGDLGTSFALGQPVRQLLAERIPETAKTIAAGLVFAWLLGLGVALVSLLPGARWLKWSASLVSNAILCVPAAALAILFVLAQAPVRLAVGVVVLPKIFTFAQALLSRTAGLPHVIAARAGGLGEWRILRDHILRVAAPQMLALVGISVCAALAACVPLEVFCGSPGIGALAWQAAQSRDMPLLVNLTMIVTLVTLGANLAADALGAAAFPGGRA